MKYAIIINSVVENIITWDGATSYVPPNGAELIDVTSQSVGPGFAYVDGVFIAPDPEPLVE